MTGLTGILGLALMGAWCLFVIWIIVRDNKRVARSKDPD